MPLSTPWSRFKAKRLAGRAARAARARDHSRALDLYERALRQAPRHARWHVQAGHMAKEAGELAIAEAHYDAAALLIPDDADLALQRGHLNRVAGRSDEAQRFYRQAVALDPALPAARLEVERLRVASPRGDDVGEAALADDGRLVLAPDSTQLESFRQRLLPEYFPSTGGRPAPPGIEVHFVRRLGRPDRTPWGILPTLRGIEALHGHSLTHDRFDEVQLLLDEQIVHRRPIAAEPRREGDDAALHKFVFNIWFDFSRYVPGRHHLRIRLWRDAPGDVRAVRTVHQGHVAIGPPLPEPALPGNDGWIPPVDPADPRPLDAQIEARPSLVRHRPRQLLPPPAAILVLRTDQLGDMAVSVPALRRLREIAPRARIVGLVTAANAEFAATLGLFDEVIEIDFPDLPDERRRVMTEAEQNRLRDRLHRHAFDAAIDLAPSDVSRALLLLANARFTMGVGDERFPWLDASFGLDVRSTFGRAGVLPAALRSLSMIEALGTMLREAEAPLRRADLDRGPLAQFGIGAETRFAVLHAGARIAGSRWPHFVALAEQLIARHGLSVVLLSEDVGLRARLPAALRDDARFALADRRLDFDALDALVSFCAVFVGNDSGPKHLAALRGAAVVSVHAARTSWSEWGQPGGAIVTRQVPCAACHIYHDEDECGRGWTCVTRITVDEVMAAIAPLLANQDTSTAEMRSPRRPA